MSVTKSPSTRRRLLPEDRRDEIIAAATQLISAVGFNATTIDHFARAAGISRPGLLHHFASRDALLEAVLERRDGDVIGAVHREATAQNSVEAREVLSELVRVNADRRQLVQLYTILAAEALAPEHPAYDYFRRRQTAATRLFAERILPWHPEPLAAAAQVIAHLDGLQLQWLRDPTIDLIGQWELFAEVVFSPYD